MCDICSVHIATIDTSTGDILDMGQPVTTLSGDHDTYWNTERLTISAPAEYKLVFVSTSGGWSYHSGYYILGVVVDKHVGYVRLMSL